MDKSTFGKQRLDAVLVHKNFCSQRASKNFLLKNTVKINGKRETDGKKLLSAEDEIEVERKNGGAIEKFKIERDVYIAIDKPKGIVCSKVSDSHRTVFEWLEEKTGSKIENLHTVGRLDAETSGLLILTTDGSFSHFVANPESGVEKTYIATLKMKVTSEERAAYGKAAARGVVLPAEKKAPEERSGRFKLEWLSESECEISVTEGKFHEVRRIFKALGNEVVELRRVSIGRLRLAGEQVMEIDAEKIFLN